MISEPLNYYDEQVIALDLTRLYKREQELLAEMIQKQSAATSMVEQKQIIQAYREQDDVIKFSDRKEEIMRRQHVANARKEAAKNKS
jgi:hypothetical protein